MENSNIIIPDFTKNNIDKKNEKVKIPDRLTYALVYHDIDFNIISIGLSKILNKIDNLGKDSQFGYIDALECVDPDNMDLVFNEPPTELFYSKYSDTIIDIGLTMAASIAIQEKYGKQPIFTNAQLEATKGQAQMLWEMEKQKAVQDVTIRIQDLLDRLLDLILYLMGIHTSNDPTAMDIVDKYIPRGHVDPRDIIEACIKLTHDAANYRDCFVWDENDEDE